ncbi:peroxisomal ATPase PEX6 isoform X2 [Dunckerocampus dactyliophorus]|uniref:peroxisomal ATPase PEX6 isoform X2 n=1 Tax=Dunckerocampus dactyliophorus TaxID=161453 RepID=UPI0024071446|nr:peroxisomal ATPase PEX6 isoform X2 [Dunckerocampus dactyliophorus]
MAAQVELFCLESFPSHLSPLDLLVSKSQLSLLFHNDNDPPTVLFTPWRPASARTPAILLRVQPVSEKEAAGFGGSRVPPGRVRLFTSGFFLRLHGLQPAGSGGTVRPVVPVSLDSVVLGTSSSHSLDRDNAFRLNADLLELCRPGCCLLARQGEPLVGEEPGQIADLLVLACSPVTQGRITADTTVVLADCNDWSDLPHLAPPPKTLQLCASDFAHAAASLGSRLSLLDKHLGSGSCGILQEHQWQLDVTIMDTRQWLEADGFFGDVDGRLFVNRRLLINLGLFDGEWVKLWLAGRPNRLRAAMVTSLDAAVGGMPIHHEGAVISEMFWFNLTAGDETNVSCGSLRLKFCLRGGGDHTMAVVALTLARPGRHSPASFMSSQWHRRSPSSRIAMTTCCPHTSAAAVWCRWETSLGFRPETIQTCWRTRTPSQARSGAQFCSSRCRRCVLLRQMKKKKWEELIWLIDCTRPSSWWPFTFHVKEIKAFYSNFYLQSLKWLQGSPVNSMVPSGAVVLWSGPCPAGLEQTVDVIARIVLPHRHGALPACTLLLYGPAGSGKVTAVSAATYRLHLHLLKVDCVTVCGDTPAATEAKLMSLFQRADAVQPCVLLLRNLQLLLRPRGVTDEDGRVQAAFVQMLKSAPGRVAVVATVCKPQELSPGIMAAFVHQVAIESPTEEQRDAMLGSLTRDLSLARDVSLERLAKVTAGFVLGDLSALLAEAGRAACRRLVLACRGRREEDLCSSGVTIQNQDILSALHTLQDVQSEAVGAPKIPNVRWEDVGGLQQVKKDILDTVQLPLQRPELLSLNLNRTGILLYGPPGTGKTLLAKAVATECSMTFLSVKGPELLNMYVGQSEENIREVFNRARSAAPCVVFFDELDSLAPSRGRSGDSGGVMDRVVSQLLAELDALPASAQVFVIGATNRPDLLDQSLLRPGRFDKLVYVGINEDRSSQLQVLQAILRNFHLAPDVDLLQVVERCPAHMSGADLYALCSDAMTAAIKRKISLVHRGLDSEDSPVHLSVDDFTVALDGFHASVSQEELLRYKHLQHTLTAASMQHGR